MEGIKPQSDTFTLKTIKHPSSIREIKDKMIQVIALDLGKRHVQIMANGIIESYSYQAMKCIEQHGLHLQRKKGKNLYKWLYGKLGEIYKRTRIDTKEQSNVIYNNILFNAFPFYGKDYLQAYDFSATLQAHFIKVQKHRLDRLQAEAFKLYEEYEAYECELLTYASIILSTAGGMHFFAYECRAKQESIVRNSGIKLAPLRTDLYDFTAKMMCKYFDDAMGDKTVGGELAETVFRLNDEYQKGIADQEILTGLNNTFGELVEGYLNYCMARLIIDYGKKNEPKGVWDYCDKYLNGLRSVKILKREMTMLNKSGITDIDDMMDYMSERRTPVIDVLKDCLTKRQK